MPLINIFLRLSLISVQSNVEKVKPQAANPAAVLGDCVRIIRMTLRSR